jgi:hypothetical protein
MNAANRTPPAPGNLTGNLQCYPSPGVSVDGHPCNIYGYPAFTTWLAASEDNVVVRRFDIVHGRVLLYMQDHIVEKESQLRELDRPGNTIVNSSVINSIVGNSSVTNSLLANVTKLLD